MTQELFTIEKGILTRAGRVSLTAEDSVRAGMALCRLTGGFRQGIGQEDAPAARGLLAAAESGILQEGGMVWNFGSSFESRFCFCLNRSEAAGGIFADQAGQFHLYGQGGLPLTLGEERRFLRLMHQGRQEPVIPEKWGRSLDMSNMGELYEVELLKNAGTTFSGMGAAVKCANPIISALMEQTLSKLGCRLEEGRLTLQISADGKNISVYESMQDVIHTEQILCLICMELFQKGQDAAVPASAPRALDEAAEKAGRRVFRFSDELPGREDKKARNLALRQPFLRDGLLLGMRLLSQLRRQGGSLRKLETEMPEFSVVSRLISPPAPPERGIILNFSRGELRIRPLPGRRAVFLSAEGKTVEAAAELCRFGEENLLRGQIPTNNSLDIDGKN